MSQSSHEINGIPDAHSPILHRLMMIQMNDIQGETESETSNDGTRSRFYYKKMKEVFNTNVLLKLHKCSV